MQTFNLRMEKHSQTTASMLNYLRELPFIEHVYYPRIDGQQLTGYGGIVFVDIRPDLVPFYKTFTGALKWFGTGTGMACVTSMVAQPFSGSHASMTDQEKADMGIDKGLVRLCFGLEDLEDLKEDLPRHSKPWKARSIRKAHSILHSGVVTSNEPSVARCFFMEKRKCPAQSKTRYSKTPS